MQSLIKVKNKITMYLLRKTMIHKKRRSIEKHEPLQQSKHAIKNAKYNLTEFKLVSKGGKKTHVSIKVSITEGGDQILRFSQCACFEK